MNVEIKPTRGELKVTLIEAGTDISHTLIEDKVSFELISADTVIYIEKGPKKTPAPDTQLSFDF